MATKVRSLQDFDEAAQQRAALDVPDGHSGDPGDEGDPNVTRRRVTPKWRKQYTAALVASDLVVTAGSVAFGTMLGGAQESPWVALPFAVCFVGALTIARAYEHRFIGAGFEEFRRMVFAGVALIALLSTIAYATQISWRGLVLIGAPLALSGSLMVHLVARQVLFRLRRLGKCTRRVVVIGTERSVAELVRVMRADPSGGVQLVAACVSKAQGPDIDGIPVAGTPVEAVSVLRKRFGDTIVLTAWSDVSEEELRRLSWSLEGSGAQLLVAPRITGVAAPRLHVQNVGGRALLTVEAPEFHGLRRLAKGVLDYGLTIPGLIVLSPLLIAIAIAIRVDSPGPVLFRQERIGKDGVPFRMTKFRSMYIDAEERLAELTHLNEHNQGPMFKMKDDPRVTKVGAFIRRLSLDELPQLFDVLLGTMSLVGPRPPLPREVATYEQDTRRRLLVKPGITGLWQVSGRSDLSWEESVRLDLSYVENWSLALDLSIITRTLSAVVTQRGAY